MMDGLEWKSDRCTWVVDSNSRGDDFVLEVKKVFINKSMFFNAV